VAADNLQKIKEAVLGKRYDLSVAFVSTPQMRKAMRYKRAKALKTSNVLAFPLSKTSGEILICKAARKPYTVEFLFIHACLHLKGLKHGATMEREENRLLKRFGFARNG
jgi:ssRNA-specific RNase YbeY (16S rRNA maturation enzyme)